VATLVEADGQLYILADHNVNRRNGSLWVSISGNNVRGVLAAGGNLFALADNKVYQLAGAAWTPLNIAGDTISSSLTTLMRDFGMLTIDGVLLGISIEEVIATANSLAGEFALLGVAPTPVDVAFITLDILLLPAEAGSVVYFGDRLLKDIRNVWNDVKNIPSDIVHDITHIITHIFSAALVT
jgi:hypothetical protein